MYWFQIVHFLIIWPSLSVEIESAGHVSLFVVHFVYVFPCLGFKQPPGNFIKLFFIQYGRTVKC